MANKPLKTLDPGNGNIYYPLPIVTESDAGKVLSVGSDGIWAAIEKDIYDKFTITYGDVSGASYGFALNSNGYYESTNQGVSSSAALCVVTFNMLKSGTVYFDCINYAESSYDYGILSNIDETLGTTYSADSSYYHSFKGSQMATIQTVSYAMEAGTHFIYVKYRKDSSVDENNDSLQFQVRVELDA